MMNLTSINVHHIEDPFYIQEMPLGNNVYVIDNYLPSNVHHHIDRYLDFCGWQKTNQVLGTTSNRGGLPNHSLWGCSFYSGWKREETEVTGYKPYIIRYLDRKIQTDFGFRWERFQYAGGNSQTHGQHGTSHADCQPEDNWNLSFLYYTNKFWNPHWGGKLRMYDRNIQTGILSDMDDYELDNIDFVPNRLLMFDGRIPHGAEAPSENARYIDRRSIVIRGDEISLLSEEQRYAND